jgi:formate-dependent nitrite reductase membrane component NrfD
LYAPFEPFFCMHHLGHPFVCTIWAILLYAPFGPSFCMRHFYMFSCLIMLFLMVVSHS